MEPVAIGASVAVKSEPYLELHVNAAVQAGASLAEIKDAVATAEKVQQELDYLITKIREELNDE
ncbi:MAG: hypothetical protein EG824_05030 [Deltaproteobacteria bacterium]|nr:hypothetical protein [Deltaproteobacteria bacterium]